MTKQLKFKTLALCAILLAGIIFPTILTAQRSDGFFKSGDEGFYENREGEINGITAPYFGDKPAPLSGGLHVLVAAGICYAVTRRKRSLRKGTTLLLALTLTLGMTQCKKRIDNVTTNSGDSILLTLKVNNGGKHHIDPNTLGSGYVPIYFDAKNGVTPGDYIYVGNGSNYIGTLECIVPSDYYGNGAVFQGTISGVNNGDVLHFYFIGGLTPSVAPTNSTTDFTIDITNQSSKLPVLSYGTGVYNDGNISCSLDNKCALVEFRFASGTSNTVKISNMLSKAKINFANPDNPIEPLESPLDAITLYSQNSTQKWAILLPGQQRSAMGMVATTSEDCGYYYYDNVTVRALSNNTYIHGNGENGAILVDNSTANINNRVFQVSANGNAVHISMGNLKCTRTGETWTPQGYEWSFIYPPYQLIETGTTSVGTDYSNRNVVDHFGWGCTGYQDKLHNSGQQYYLPYNTTISQNHYDLYGPTSTNTEHYNLIVSNFSDWGYVNITNGGNYKWRLLTETEWDYMMNHRFNAEGSKAPARVIGCNGWIVLPEKWEGHTLKPGTSQGSEYTYNKITTAQGYVDSIQSHGAIFLPACGSRNNEKVSSVNSSARYWLSTVYDQDKAYSGNVTKSSGTGTTAAQRSLGYCVRLVR